MERAELCVDCPARCKLRNALQASEIAIKNGGDALRANRVVEQIESGNCAGCTQIEAIKAEINKLNPAFDIKNLEQIASS